MIHIGRLFKYGREEIKEVIKEWLNTPAKPVTHPEKRFDAGDGEYVFDIGKMELKFTNGQVSNINYECIYKKENGKYMLYQDKLVPLGDFSDEKKE